MRCALSNHWRYGGEGAIELAETVIDACQEKNEIKFLYPLEMPLRQRVELAPPVVAAGHSQQTRTDQQLHRSISLPLRAA